jgi:hypothetical protein
MLLLLLQILVLLLEKRDAEEMVLVLQALHVVVVAEPGAIAGGAGR